MRIGLILALVLSVIALGAKANPEFWKGEGWKTDFSRTVVDLSEIMSGGPGRDGIPPIDDPQFVAAAEADYNTREPVIAFGLGNDRRAYPLAVLIWHEIVNDTVDGKPVAITYCPLCDSSIVFDRSVDGRALRFGTTGKLRFSDLVMWDDATESWWQQFTGRALVGAFAGRQLTVLPSRVEAFGLFRAAHPQGKVLVPHDENRRAYGANPYIGYDRAAWPLLYRGEAPDGLPALARVVRVGERAWTLDLLRARGRIETRDGLVLTWTPGQATALGNRTIAKGADIGNVLVRRNGAAAIFNVTFAFAFHAFVPKGVIFADCAGERHTTAPVRCF